MSGPSGCGEVQEPNWGEATDSERIDRLRKVVKQLQQELRESDQMRWRLQQTVENHQHLDGAVVTRACHYHGDGLGQPSFAPEVWF